MAPPPRPEGRWERRVGIASLVAVFAVHAAVLLQEPVVGTAENGDFGRVMQPAGIRTFDDYKVVGHRWVSQTYGLGPAQLDRGFSSAAVVAFAARFLGGQGETLDIRQVGAAYLLLFAATFAGALAAGAPALRCALLAWAALDVSYSLYLNSFFADGAALLGFLGVTLCLLDWDRVPRHAWGRWARRGLLLLAALSAGFSKNLYMLSPLVVAVALVVWPGPGWATRLRAEALLLVALVAGGGLAVRHFTSGSGYRYPEINNHNAVFFGLTAVSDDPAAALVELGLDPRHAGFAGTSFYAISGEQRTVSAAALHDLSRGRLALAYLRHPRRIARALPALVQPLADTTTVDPNFSDRTRPPGFYSAWWQFARWRGASGLLAVAVVGVALAVLARAAATRSWSSVHAALAFLILNGALVMAGCLLGDGFWGLRRHLMATRFSIDLTGAILLFAGYEWGRQRYARRRPAR